MALWQASSWCELLAELGTNTAFWLLSGPWQGDPRGWGVTALVLKPLSGRRGVGAAALPARGLCARLRMFSTCEWWMLLENVALRRGALQAAQVICTAAHRCCSCPEPCYSQGWVQGMLPLCSGGSGSAAAGGCAGRILAWHGMAAVPVGLSPCPLRESRARGAAAGAPRAVSRQELHGRAHRQIRLGRCFMEYADPGMERALNNYTHSQIFLNKAIYSILQK